MSEIRISSAQSVPLAKRLRSVLRSKLGGTADTTCLLLDISGSMDEWIGPNQTKMSELRKLAAQFTDIRTFIFSSTCEELPKGTRIPDTNGGTAMGLAFTTVKLSRIDHVIMITDGEPDNEQQALKASDGLRIDCFYVGPDPAPAFLKRLCNHTSGQYGDATLTNLGELTSAVKERLQIAAPKGNIAL